MLLLLNLMFVSFHNVHPAESIQGLGCLWLTEV